MTIALPKKFRRYNINLERTKQKGKDGSQLIFFHKLLQNFMFKISNV